MLLLYVCQTNANWLPHSSSGLLIYAALVDLLAEDFLSEEANHTLTTKQKKIAFMWVLLGGKLAFSPLRSAICANDG